VNIANSMEQSPTWGTHRLLSHKRPPLVPIASQMNLIQKFPSYFSYLLTYSRSRALLEERPIVQPAKNFPAFYRTLRFNTLHWVLSWAISIQSTLSQSIALRSILILSTHLRLCLPSEFFSSGFPPITYMHSCSPLFVLHAPPIPSFLTWSF
jgi:hypothetical protein